jgi:hypothetical protein
MSLFLLLVLVAVVLGLIGAVAHGLGWLLAIGVVVFVAALAYGLRRLRGRGRTLR